MTVTLIGMVTDKLGQAQYSSVGWEGRAAVERRTYEAISSLEYRRAQPARIPVDVDHRGAEVGEVLYLERSEDDSVVAVCVPHGHDEMLAPSHRARYFSPSLRFHP